MCLQVYLKAFLAKRKCESWWLDWMQPVKRQSFTNSNLAKLWQRFLQLVSYRSIQSVKVNLGFRVKIISKLMRRILSAKQFRVKTLTTCISSLKHPIKYKHMRLHHRDNWNSKQPSRHSFLLFLTSTFKALTTNYSWKHLLTQ